MRVEYLSDNVGDLVRQAEQRVQAVAGAAQWWQWCWQQAEADQVAARRARPWWQKLLRVRSDAEWDAYGRAKEAAERWRQTQVGWGEVGGALKQVAAGKQGEDELAAGLGPLSDEWLLFRGYRNRRGEIDGLLVGPGGVWAVEVKRMAIHLAVDGTSWTYRRLDRSTGLATDGGGRTWAREVGDPADALAGWLASQSAEAPVRTAVLILHPRATIDRSVNPGVDLLATDTSALLRLAVAAPRILDAARRATVEDLIRRDHAHDQQRRQNRQGGPAR